MNIYVMSLKYQITFTVRRIQLSDTDVSKHHKILLAVLAKCPAVFHWLENVTILRLYFENKMQTK